MVVVINSQCSVLVLISISYCSLTGVLVILAQVELSVSVQLLQARLQKLLNLTRSSNSGSVCFSTKLFNLSSMYPRKPFTRSLAPPWSSSDLQRQHASGHCSFNCCSLMSANGSATELGTNVLSSRLQQQVLNTGSELNSE